MERESRWIWWVAAGVVLLLAALRWGPRAAGRLAPGPRAAHVAIELDASGVASNGRFEIASGSAFRLHAVLEAETLSGETIYYTAARALRLNGVDVPVGRLRRWPERRVARVRWFTVESFTPYFAPTSSSDLARFRMNENFQPAWGTGWSVDGLIDPKNVQLEASSPLRPLPFGTQRYAVRIELFASAEALTPELRVASAGAEAALVAPERVTTLVAGLPAPLTSLSRRYGLTQLELAAEADPSIAAAARGLIGKELAFERVEALRTHLEASGSSAASLAWRELDLAAGDLGWGREIEPGDLLQGGGRIVILFRDQGEPGRLDGADLCLDFDRGAKVYRLDRLFPVREGATVEWAALPREPLHNSSGSR